MTLFLGKLHRLETGMDSISSLLDCYSDLMGDLQQKPAPEKPLRHSLLKGSVAFVDSLREKVSSGRERQEPAAGRKEIASLVEELATYIYYCVTLLEFFTDDLDAIKFNKAEEAKGFNELARARQALAVNPKISRLMISRFRVCYSMAIPEVQR